MNAALLFAAGIDWIEQLLPALFVVLWVVSQVFNAFRAAGGGQKRPPVARRPAPEPRADDVRGQLEQQIGEFLRQQREGRAAAPAGRGPERPPGKAERAPPKPAPPRMPPQPPARTGSHAPRTPARAPRPPAAAHGGDVARHVQDAFAHDLEHLASALRGGGAGRAESPAAAPPSPAADLVAMLRNPVTVRQLVLLREVLERPTDRW